MTPALRPTTEAELADAIAQAAGSGERLSIACGASKAAIGAAVPATTLDMTGFASVIDYDPAELVLTVGAGTPLGEIETLVASQGQMLAFAPFDHGPLFGAPAGRASIGGVVAAGVAGSQRLAFGGVRDHLLGFRAVSGRGQAFVAGAKVVKNVTGYDLPKLAAGSWGRLFALTEVTLKVLPRPRARATWLVEGLGPDDAVAAMATAMGSQAEVAAAAHLPESAHAAASTLLRVQGFGPSVDARGRMLADLLAPFGAVRRAEADEAASLWGDLRDLARFPADGMLWRVNVRATRAAGVVRALALPPSDWLMDWAGALIWLVFDGEPARVRRAAEEAGGHAMLVRAPAEARARIPALHPGTAAIALLEERVRRAFDPAGVFETGRF